MTAERQARSRRWGIVVAAALLAFVSAACGGDGASEEQAGTTTAEADADAVVIELVAFKPETVSVRTGATVTWQQKDTGDHTVTSGTVEQGTAGVTSQPDDRFDSGDISKGETFEFTFTEAGRYPYFCRLHPATMRGEITVR